MQRCPSFRAFMTLAFCLVSFSSVKSVADQKEWTLLVFINGHNNLDEFGAVNINQMETVGSTDKINLVVQWASEASLTTKRILVTKDNDTEKVGSPVVEEFARPDMGDYKTFVDFVKWGMAKYPAKHYFVDIWNHGGGWARRRGVINPMNISYDDLTKNSITTPQMGIAMKEIKAVLGRNVDILGSDACMMAMAEINHEVAPYVDMTVASEENIPGMGWPYDKFVKRWADKPEMNAAEVTKILAEEHVKFYGEQGRSVTLSSVDLTKTALLAKTIANLATEVKKLDSADRKLFTSALDSSIYFAYGEYVDLGNLLDLIAAKNIRSISSETIKAVSDAIATYVVENKTTTKFQKARGVSIWGTTSSYYYNKLKDRYQELAFQKETGWGDALGWLQN